MVCQQSQLRSCWRILQVKQSGMLAEETKRGWMRSTCEVTGLDDQLMRVECKGFITKVAQNQAYSPPLVSLTDDS